MKNNQIKIVLILLSISLFSCGKEANTVADQSPEKPKITVPGQPKPSGRCPTIVYNKDDLVSALDSADSFPSESYSPYSYQHWECTLHGSALETCGTVGVPLRSGSQDVNGIKHELASTKTALLEILQNAASNSRKHKIVYDRWYPDGTLHQITASSSHKHPIWTINLCLPLIANPVVKKNRK